MRKRYGKVHFMAGVALASLALTACEQSGSDVSGEIVFADTEMVEASTDETMADEAASGSDMAALEGRAELPVNLPKMAYTYGFGFRLPSSDIAALQQRHADMCEARGPYVCQIVQMSHSGDVDDDYATGRLELAVVSEQAREFGKALSEAAESAGSEQVTAGITGEDLSKNIVDTEARLRSRVMLRDRMMEVLRTRRGSVEELVQAERSVAQINEEIDQARSWLEEMKGRVAYARVNIDYSTHAAPASDFLSPVSGAVASIGTILGYLLALAIVLATIAVPVGLGVIGARWAKRRWGVAEV